MEIILLEKIENLGAMGDKVNVKPGYGRNYLIPKGMAIAATETNRKIQAENLKQKSFKEEKQRLN